MVTLADFFSLEGRGHKRFVLEKNKKIPNSMTSLRNKIAGFLGVKGPTFATIWQKAAGD